MTVYIPRSKAQNDAGIYIAPVEFTVYGTPQPAGSKRAFPFANASGKLRVRVTDDNAKSRPWKDSVGWEARAAMAGRTMLEGPLAVSMTFYRKRPKGHTGKMGPTREGRANPYPIARPDVLKLARGVEDAMTGLVYADDAQICFEALAKKWGTPERVEVSVEVMS